MNQRCSADRPTHETRLEEFEYCEIKCNNIDEPYVGRVRWQKYDAVPYTGSCKVFRWKDNSQVKMQELGLISRCIGINHEHEKVEKALTTQFLR